MDSTEQILSDTRPFQHGPHEDEHGNSGQNEVTGDFLNLLGVQKERSLTKGEQAKDKGDPHQGKGDRHAQKNQKQQCREHQKGFHCLISPRQNRVD